MKKRIIVMLAAIAACGGTVEAQQPEPLLLEPESNSGVQTGYVASPYESGLYASGFAGPPVTVAAGLRDNGTDAYEAEDFDVVDRGDPAGKSAVAGDGD